jgi:hypothetical protein
VEIETSSLQAENGHCGPLVQKLAIMLSSYAKAINKQENRSGSLFKPKTKAKSLSEGDRNYAETCFHYIHQNPPKAKLVENIEDWKFSSYRDYAGLRNGTLPKKELGIDTFNISNEQQFRKRSQQMLDIEKVEKIF